MLIMLVIAPLSEKKLPIHLKRYQHDSLSFCSVPYQSTLRVGTFTILPICLPLVMLRIIRGMIWVIIFTCVVFQYGIVGSYCQIFFPHKIKAVKYANNWDPDSSQAAAYRFQQHLLRNSLLTRKASACLR